ncbi:MAG TPA: hypothetical protein PKD45_03030 [Flavobacteriales bacterium]|nr:hypothetical protein [Flavobacteriales bacterium]
MRFTPLLLTLMLAVPGQAQDNGHPLERATARTDSATRAALTDSGTTAAGDVRVVESARIKALMADYAAKKQPLKGYRVQIYLGDRTTAETVRRNFMLQHPDIPAYLSYLAPNFRVRVGDLRDRVTAEFLRESLKTGFPGLYIVPDEIEPPALLGAEAPVH